MMSETSSIPKTFTEATVFKQALEYFKNDDLAARVWMNKYALKNANGEFLEASPDAMHKRIAGEIARIESKYSNPLSEATIYNLIKDFKYIVPQGSPMAGIGNPHQVASLSNCFVIGNSGASDSYGGIMKIDQEQVQLMKRRGGVGHDLSHIRPEGSKVKNAALTSTGVVPFMERYSNSTREVAQDGRRGALMLSLAIKHPDAAQFIDAKLDTGKVTGANVSIRIDNAFMEAVKAKSEYTQTYPIYSENPKTETAVDANVLWKKIIHNAWKSAEPGVLFWDTIIAESLPDCYADKGYKTLSTNPCGEIPLCAYDSCRLLAINLFSYVEAPFTENAQFNFKLFKEHAVYAQRIMDDVIDLELEKIDAILQKIDADPEDESVKAIERNLWLAIKHKAQEGRRTGIGITAEGDMLAALGLKYGTDTANAFALKLHKTLALEVYRSSANLAKERGAFAIYDAKKEQNNPFVLRIKEADEALYYEMQAYGRRNIALLTIAPTGTTSIMTQTSSGIEPVFLPVYNRRRKVNPNDKNARVDFTDEVGDTWEEYTVFHHKFKLWMQVNGIDTAKTYTQEELDALVKQSPYFEATSNDVNWLSKVEMQGAIQKWVDHSISVTINLPNAATEDLVGDLYMKAWEVGCKGVTVYRDGSRSGVLVATNANDNTAVTDFVSFPKKRPQSLEADVVRFQNKKEKWIAFIGLINDRPYEIFTGLADDEDGILLPRWVSKGVIIKNRNDDGSSRYDFQYKNTRGYKTTIEGLSHKFNPEFWNYAKLISSTLRHGMPIDKIVDLVNSLQLDSASINSWKNGVGRALKRYVEDGTEAKGEICSNCKSKSVVYQEGCLTCKNCGTSKCG